MQPSAVKQEKLSYAEYLALEATAEERHIFWDGSRQAMSGGTLNHSLLETQLILMLGSALKGRPCRPFSGNRRLRSPEEPDRAVYADLSVICGKSQPHPEDPDASTNPTVVIEVLSPSTEGFDRGKKFAYYRTFPTLRSYVLVAQDQVLVEHYYRQGERWMLDLLGPGEQLVLPEIDVRLEVDQIYQDTELGEAVRQG